MSLLQTIENNLASMDEATIKQVAINDLVCYIAYCHNTYSYDYSHISTGKLTWSSTMFIELPDETIQTLEKHKLIGASVSSSGKVNRTVKFSAYFYNRGYTDIADPFNTFSTPIMNTVYQYDVSDIIKHEYFKFIKKDADYKLNVVREFLSKIEDYITGIANNYSTQLSSCC